MREYIVGTFKNRDNAVKAVELLGANSIESSFAWLGEYYEVTIVGFADFHMATTLIGSMDVK